jgi:PiT family inorganic phosphate transporter
LTKVLAAIVISPLMGFTGGFVLLVAVYWSCFRVSRSKAMPWFKNLQRGSAAYMAFSNGRNDAQKPMGILALTLALYWGRTEVAVPIWVVVSCVSVAALGTAYGGWRIIHTVGSRVAGLDPAQGFAAELAGASVLLWLPRLAFPSARPMPSLPASLGGACETPRRCSLAGCARYRFLVDHHGSDRDGLGCSFPMGPANVDLTPVLLDNTLALCASGHTGRGVPILSLGRKG